mmetsp:Transcript_18149/g.48821  ORF Transcript_18149/g.48821 Transcript_18149/m.48821 type:complete len:403 (-) Transcript_18149:16-1224(-)
MAGCGVGGVTRRPLDLERCLGDLLTGVLAGDRAAHEAGQHHLARDVLVHKAKEVGEGRGQDAEDGKDDAHSDGGHVVAVEVEEVYAEADGHHTQEDGNVAKTLVEVFPVAPGGRFDLCRISVRAEDSVQWLERADNDRSKAKESVPAGEMGLAGQFHMDDDAREADELQRPASVLKALVQDKPRTFGGILGVAAPPRGSDAPGDEAAPGEAHAQDVGEEERLAAFEWHGVRRRHYGCVVRRRASALDKRSHLECLAVLLALGGDDVVVVRVGLREERCNLGVAGLIERDSEGPGGVTVSFGEDAIAAVNAHLDVPEAVDGVLLGLSLHVGPIQGRDAVPAVYVGEDTSHCVLRVAHADDACGCENRDEADAHGGDGALGRGEIEPLSTGEGGPSVEAALLSW